MKKIMLTVMYSSLCFGHGINDFNIDVKKHEEKVFSDENIMIFNHNSSRWDTTESSIDGLEKVLSFYHERRDEYRSLMVVNDEGIRSEYFASKYYLNSDDVDYTVASPDGSHLIRFPNAKTITMSGGDLSMCLCEAMRDSVRGTTINDEALSIRLVTDAIYATTFFFERFLQDHVYQKKMLTVSEIFSHLSREQIKAFLNLQIIRNSTMICPLQSRSPEGQLNLEHFEFIFELEHSELLRIGNGKKKVIVSFIHSSDLFLRVL